MLFPDNIKVVIGFARQYSEWIYANLSDTIEGRVVTKSYK
nr:hypothetical protein [Raoultella ornithinolytica]UFD96501.1 hypothetical protein [Klebsiella oxytoca]UGK55300.1 Hypothetical protein [Raoultella ornithinolytica]